MTRRISIVAIPLLLAGAQAPVSLNGHQRAVTSVACSPDGRWIASGSLDHTARLWDIPSQREVRVLKGHNAEVYAVAFSPDSRYIASAGRDRRVLLWEVATGKLARTIEGFPDWSVAIGFSPDGAHIAIGRQDGKVEIHDVTAIKSPTILASKEPFYSVGALAYSPDGKFLAMSWTRVVVWDLHKGDVAATLRIPQGFISSILFSPDGSLIAAACFDKSVHIWSTATWKAGPVLQAAPAKLPLAAIAFSPDSRRLATAGADKPIWLWDVTQATLLRTFEGHTMTVTGLAFTPDGETLVSGSLDQTVRLWSW